MDKYFYAFSIFTFSAFVVLAGLLTSNTIYSATGRVAGVQSDDQLLTYAVNYPNKLDFEVYCDGRGGYVAAMILAPIPAISPALTKHFHVVQGRGYFAELDANSLNHLIADFGEAQGIRHDYTRAVANCHMLK